MTSLPEFDNDEVEDILAVVEAFLDELLEEFDTDNEKVGAIASNIVMSLALLRQVKADSEVIAWLNSVVHSWVSFSEALH